MFLFLAGFTSLLGLLGGQPFESFNTFNQVTVLFLLCIRFAIDLIFLRLLFPLEYVESKVALLLHINYVFSILYFASIVILLLWFCFVLSIFGLV